MNNTPTPIHGKTVRARFIPFEQMTPRQQAEHLTMAHGMGADYWDHSTGEAPLADDAAVVAWYLTGAHWTRPENRAILHDEDHAYLEGEADGILECVHIHDKH